MTEYVEPVEPRRFFRESDHPLARLYRKRVEQNRDLVVLITDANNDRGTGKTTEALRLGHGMDRTDEGLTTDKTAIDPYPMLNAYTEQPKGSGLVLDESEEGADKYQAASSVNSAVRSLVSMGRIEEKYLVMNAPADHLIDSDLKSLVDVWVLIQQRGVANCYRMKWNAHGGHRLAEGMGTLEWGPIPEDTNLHKVYQHLTDEKTARLRGDEGEQVVSASEMEDRVEKVRKEARREMRNELIQELAERDVSHRTIAEATDLSRSHVSNIANQQGAT
jgi:hypothetical protein